MNVHLCLSSPSFSSYCDDNDDDDNDDDDGNKEVGWGWGSRVEGI